MEEGQGESERNGWEGCLFYCINSGESKIVRVGGMGLVSHITIPLPVIHVSPSLIQNIWRRTVCDNITLTFHSVFVTFLSNDSTVLRYALCSLFYIARRNSYSYRTK